MKQLMKDLTGLAVQRKSNQADSLASEISALVVSKTEFNKHHWYRYSWQNKSIFGKSRNKSVLGFNHNSTSQHPVNLEPCFIEAPNS